MLTSEKVNYLVWKYLQEEGLQLAAAALDRETHASLWESDDVPVGELVKLLLKGQQLTSIEGTLGRKAIPPQPNLPGKEIDNLSGLTPIGLETPIQGGFAVTSCSNGLALAGIKSAAFYHNDFKTVSQLDSGGDIPTSVAAVNSKLGIFGYVSGALRLWALGELSESHVLQAVMVPETSTAPILLLRLSSSEKLLGSVDAQNYVRVWDLETRTVVLESKFDELIEDFVWLGGDSSVGIVSEKGISILSINSAENKLSESTGDLLKVSNACVAIFNSLSQTLYVGTRLGCLASITLDHSINSWPAHAAQISALIRLDNKILSTGVDGSVTVWDLKDKAPEASASRNLGEPILDAVADSQSAKVALITPTSVHILHSQTLDALGEIKQVGVQSLCWVNEVLAVSSRMQTELYKIV